MLVKELYLDCIRNEITFLAHYIYHLLVEQKLSLHDDSTKIDLVHADLQKVEELIHNNVLGIHKICVYSLKMTQMDFVFIFAASEDEAIQFFTKLTIKAHGTVMNIH